MASTLKVTNIDTPDGTGNITVDRPLSGSGASLTSLSATALASGTVPTARLGSGTASSSTFLRGDSTYAAVSAGADTDLSNLSSTGENKVCQVWINFNGTGTIAIRDSFNVSSITDNGTGMYTVTFTSALANTNYSVSGIGGRQDTDADPSYWHPDLHLQNGSSGIVNTGSVLIAISHDNTMTLADTGIVCIIIFGD